MEKNEKQKTAFEQKKDEIAILLLDEINNFVRIDNKINGHIESIFGSLADHIKNNPNAFDTKKNDIHDLIDAIKVKGDTSKNSDDIKGGDILGGSILSDICDAINALTPFINGEKDFFKELFGMIFQ
jgi:hypothetical protein